MESDIYLFDTYALIEILNKNKNYEKYSLLNPIINDFIFAEFCYKLFRENIKNAKEYIQEIESSLIYANKKTICSAMEFRVKNKEKNLSMTDCISYLMAKNLGIRFLTGDKQFENLENVEFIK